MITFQMMSSNSRPQRKRPAINSYDARLKDFYLFWFLKTGSYSEILTFNSLAWKHIDPEKRLSITKVLFLLYNLNLVRKSHMLFLFHFWGEETYLKDGTKMIPAVLLARGTSCKLYKACRLLDFLITADIDNRIGTDVVLSLHYDDSKVL